jgi:hypothetical protein
MEERQQIRVLDADRTAALRQAWRVWHEQRVALRHRIRVYERFARDTHAELEKLYECKPPPLPTPHGYGGPESNGKVKE